MTSNVFDKNGKEVSVGDTLVFPYIDPLGGTHDTEDFKATVLFKYGCFGYETATKFIPLMKWMEEEQGEYISNCGNKTIYTEKYPFWINNSNNK